ncbi:bifunctional oligoribonuclease/PAP phosphatase NrnA [Fulvivirgaceae bacterium PWU4]|uniref:Bifunctional oligoribonuclease/PAP phosphatase NrnA n=1 Tax=Chryseosolibacter histidini TaxID=2782349 RepID=A0AAP2DMC7_9BACT|nr:bifunctional oligoribonuclease/PAP phosphatase NrnA [Chryseosolibacter histidini]MBT1698985.1 bifunctional oligoribonuclease/PAP phosphatase NrnA [Chryseosolibacter histidini]
MQNLPAFKEFMNQPRKVVIVTHVKPDADALGSSLGLAGYLKKKGHTVKVITPSDYPDFLTWMPGNSEVLIFQKDKPKAAEAFISQSDIVFCLDFSSLQRINELGKMVEKATAKKVLIDHHLEPEKFAEFEQWDDTAASTAELVYKLIRDIGDEDLVDQNIANCLYAGIMTDTGGFRHPNTTYEVFQIASALVAHGADPSGVSKLIYDTNTLERLRLMGFVLSEKLNVLPEYRTAFITLSAEELKKFGSQTGDTEGLVNYGLSIKGIRLSALISDRKENIKLSFRSLGSFSVNELARKHFEGGGHRNAAGGQTNLTLDETVKKFLDLLPQYKDQLLAD